MQPKHFSQIYSNDIKIKVTTVLIVMVFLSLLLKRLNKYDVAKGFSVLN